MHLLRRRWPHQAPARRDIPVRNRARSLPRCTINPVTFTKTMPIPDFDGRAYSLEEIALMLTVLPEPSRTFVGTAALAGSGPERFAA